LFLLLFVVIVSSCGTGGGSSSSGSTGVSGLAQKGPFATGGTVTAYQLVGGARSGTSATTTINSDLGSYNFSSLAWSGATEVEIVGKYFNENTNTNTATVGTLTSIVNVAGKTNFNVNVFTSLAAEKVKDLLASGKTITQAKSEAETAIKELFGLDSSVDITKLDITKKGDNPAAAAEMLRVSAAIAASPTILISLADDIKDKSNVRGGDAFQNLETELTTIDNNFATITANIGSLTGNADDVPDTISTNTAPVITFSTNTITINEDSSAITRTLTATDAQNDTITFSAQSSDATKAGVSVSGDELTITPVANANGTLTITIGASDGKFSTYSEFELDITAVNDKPVITPNQSFAIAENSSSGVEVGTVAATDIENDSLSNWTIASGNTGSAFSISSAGVIQVVGSLDTETTGSYTLGITVSDGTNTSNEVQVNIDITNVNEAPALTKPSDISTTYGTNATTISLSGSDVDSTALTYSASASDTGIASTSVNGSDISITPQGAGNTIITVGVNDGEFTTQQTLTITVAKKAITLTANEVTKVYNTANPTFSHDNNGVESGDTFSGSLSTSATLTSNVGTYDITSTLANANYDITFIGTNKFSITKANQADITVNNLEKDATDANFVPDIASGGNGTGTVVATASSEPSVATITAGVIDILAAGNTTITIKKQGDTNYNDSNETTFVLTVEAAQQQAQGVAVDGYLAGSDVCLDLNINDACDQNEPTSKTGSNGAYTLTYSAEVQADSRFATSPILIVGGTDVGLDLDKPDNKPFVGSLKALNTLTEGQTITEINLSPATKMLADGVIKERAKAEATSTTFTVGELNQLVVENEPKIKKAMKIPDDKPLTIDLSKSEYRESYQQSLSIHKALETMVEARMNAQKASASTTTITAIDAMDEMYEIAFDAILDDDFADELQAGTFTATDLLTHIETDANIKDKVPDEAKKVIDRAKGVGNTVFNLFEGYKDTQTSTVDLTAINKIEEVIKLEFEALEKELKDFDFTSNVDLTATTKITIGNDVENDAFFDKTDDDFEDFIAIETLQIDDKFANFEDSVLKDIIDAVQVKETQTSVVDLFEDFEKFEEVIKSIDTNTFSGTVTSAFDKFDEYLDEQKKEEEAEKKEIEAEKAKNADAYSMTLPYILYGVNTREDNDKLDVEYWQATFNNNNSLDFAQYAASSTGWVAAGGNSDNFELDSNGSWVSEQFDTANKTIEILSDNRVLLKLDGADYEKLKLFESDVSGEKIFDDELKTYVNMPESGAKRVLMSIERMTDTYRLNYIPKDYSDNNNPVAYTSIPELIAGQCGDRWFTGNQTGGYAFKHNGTQTASQQNGWRTYTCDTNASSGEIVEVRQAWNGQNYHSNIVNENAGTWKLETVHGVKLLIVTPKNPYKYSYGGGLEYPILAVKDGQVWSGDFEPKGEGDSWYAYNAVAVEAVKTVGLELYNDATNGDGNDATNGDGNGGNEGGDSGDNSGSTTFTISGHAPISITKDQSVGNNGVDLATLAGNDSTVQFKIVNWSAVHAANLGITIEQNANSGEYVVPNNNDNINYGIHVNPNGNTGTVTVQLQAKNSDGVESNIISFDVVVNDTNNTVAFNPPTSYTMSNSEGQQTIGLNDVSNLEIKIINHSDANIAHFNLGFGDNTPIGNYAANRTQLVINPGNNSGNIDLQLQAKDGNGNESDIKTISITVNDSGNNNNSSNYTSFQALVAGRCYDGVNNTNYFDRNENNHNIKLAFACDVNQNGTSGNLVSFDSSLQNPSTQTAGTWAVETVQGTAVLVVNATNPNDWDDDGDKTIFAMKDGYIWRGEIEAQPTGEVFSAYNLTAANSIKNAIISVTSDGSTTEFSDISSATAVTSITAFIGTGKEMYLEFEYCNCITPTVTLDATLLKDGAMTDKKEKLINGVWTAYQENTEYRLDSGSWVDDSSSAYTITGNSTMSIGSYGEFEVYTQSVAGDTITVLGESITLPDDSVRFYLKRISNNTPDVYYLSNKE
jgi:hypothetical protein